MAKTKPAVLLFQDDKKRVEDWVLQYPNNETGGQVFGLWTHDGNPYVNIITGPGKDCKHRSHSFHQDIEYLKNVGQFLNKEFMMCHVGEWHSHHKLRLRQPSSGDLNSIWKHFPDGVEYFLLIIATIEREGVRLNPWLFKASSHSYEAIDVRVIEKDNVFMKDDAVRRTIWSGAEMPRRQPQPQNTSTDYYSPTNGHLHQLAKPEKIKNDERWFLSDQGSIFVQLLNSKLEEIIDASTEIEKTMKGQCLRFSFQSKRRPVTLTFHHDSAEDSSLEMVCDVQGHREPRKLTFSDVQFSEDYVNTIVQFVKKCVEYVHVNRKS